MSFFLLCRLPGQPLITPQPLTAPWATDATAIPADVPVRYVSRGDGCPGDIAGDDNNGLLVSSRIANELRLIAGDVATMVPAVIENLPSACCSRDYALLRVRHVVPLGEVEMVAGLPVFAVRVGVDYIAIAAHVRRHLETIGIASGYFTEMLFA